MHDLGGLGWHTLDGRTLRLSRSTAQSQQECGRQAVEISHEHLVKNEVPIVWAIKPPTGVQQQRGGIRV
jgi:hypothetical protein